MRLVVESRLIYFIHPDERTEHLGELMNILPPKDMRLHTRSEDTGEKFKVVTRNSIK